MRVFLAGASGALGSPVVTALKMRQHEVFGTTRTPQRAAALADEGVEPLIVDAMDEDAIRRAVSQIKPEIVIDLLTALPKKGPRRLSQMQLTNKTRIVASGHLLNAAVQAGVARYIAESFYLVYGTGDLGNKPLSEDSTVPIAIRHSKLRPVIDAMVIKESRAVKAAGDRQIEAAVLRFGGFYGFGAGLEYLILALKKRQLPIVRSENAIPWVHIEDAASAVVAAVEFARSGAIYNIVDDEPRPIADVLRTMAELTGAPRPIRVPKFVLRVAAPYLKAVLVDSNIRPSNTRARAELRWTPRFRDIETGLRTILGPNQPAPELHSSEPPERSRLSQ